MSNRPDPTMLRRRYLDVSDPHDDNEGSGPPSIRVVDYMGDFDDYFDVNLLGPYVSVQARDADLCRLDALPGMYGKVELVPCTLSLAEAGVSRFDAEPDDVARATTFGEFMAGFDHDDCWLDEDDR